MPNALMPDKAVPDRTFAPDRYNAPGMTLSTEDVETLMPIREDAAQREAAIRAGTTETAPMPTASFKTHLTINNNIL